MIAQLVGLLGVGGALLVLDNFANRKTRCKTPTLLPSDVKIERQTGLSPPFEFRKQRFRNCLIDSGIFMLPVDDEFKCGLCLDVLFEARSCQVRLLSAVIPLHVLFYSNPPTSRLSFSQRGHNFCSPCILSWLEKKSTCPSCRCDLTVASLTRVLVVDHMMEKLDVRCPNVTRGCKWTGQFNFLQVSEYSLPLSILAHAAHAHMVLLIPELPSLLQHTLFACRPTSSSNAPFTWSPAAGASARRNCHGRTSIRMTRSSARSAACAASTARRR